MNLTSTFSQRASRPANTSAQQQLSSGQVSFMVIVGSLLLVGLIIGISPLTYLMVGILLLSVLYLVQMGFNIFLLYSASLKGAISDYAEEVAALDWGTLPSYAVLVPLYKETAVLKQLVINLSNLNYPKPRLTVYLLLEGDDTPMLEAVEAITLPSNFRKIVVPVSHPRTKPKALNHSLQFVEADLCVVYDAEDRPEPDQLLKAAAGFLNSPPEMICLQGKLHFHNPNFNWLTRFFAAEYAGWFTLVVPGLARNGLLLLLGGTSNHFRMQALRDIGAWDPYNVTEDADLGVRIARAGLKVKALDSVTWEEANARPWSWVKQRSRWIKGYMQTYLAHMRNPLRLLRELGLARFLAFQVMVGLGPYINMVNPLFWLLTAVYFITRSGFIEALYPGPVLYMAVIAATLGNLIAIYMSLTGAMVQGEYGNIKHMLLSPVYWSMMSVAAWRAFRQLIFNPHHWEKTQHGHEPEVAPAVTPAPALAFAASGGWRGLDTSDVRVDKQPVAEPVAQ
jgi:glycosyltransferase XagB